MDSSRSLSETQKLKAEILGNGLFTDPEEREEVLLLIDHIIWEEQHAIESARELRRENLMAITNLVTRIQEREAGPQPVSGGGQSDFLDRLAGRT